MVNKINSKIVRDIDKLNENETLAVHEYISQLLSRRHSVPTTTTATSAENQFNDDLIASLSDRRENRRAQQVVEWERTRRRNVPRAA